MSHCVSAYILRFDWAQATALGFDLLLSAWISISVGMPTTKFMWCVATWYNGGLYLMSTWYNTRDGADAEYEQLGKSMNYRVLRGQAFLYMHAYRD